MRSPFDLAISRLHTTRTTRQKSVAGRHKHGTLYSSTGGARTTSGKQLNAHGTGSEPADPHSVHEHVKQWTWTNVNRNRADAPHVGRRASHAHPSSPQLHCQGHRGHRLISVASCDRARHGKSVCSRVGYLCPMRGMDGEAERTFHPGVLKAVELAERGSRTTVAGAELSPLVVDVLHQLEHMPVVLPQGAAVHST